MPESNLTSFILLPKLKLSDFSYDRSSKIVTFECSTKSEWDICPFCTMKTSTVHDRRWVNIKDAPHGQKQKMLKVLKKRFRCQKYGCKKVFTETIPGIAKRARLTERMQREILYLSERFANLKQVSRHTSVGNKTIYKRHYTQLELEWRKIKNNPWPTTIGDLHF